MQIATARAISRRNSLTRRSPSPQILIDAGPKCLIKLPVKTSNGMDTYFVHYYEVDDAGKILKFMALDDGASLAKYCVGTTAAEPEALATLSKFCAFGDDCAEYATDDCLMNPPGAPPMPVAVMTGMMAGLRASCWPTWKSKFHGATKNADGTYNVLTQQCLGPMAADFPAMGPFPEVKLDSVPEIMKTEDLCNPVEVGKFELTEDKKKVKLCTYTISSHLGHGMPGMASPSVAGVWGAKGDGSVTPVACVTAKQAASRRSGLGWDGGEKGLARKRKREGSESEWTGEDASAGQ